MTEPREPEGSSTDEPNETSPLEPTQPALLGSPDGLTFTRRALVSGGVVAFGAAVVWTSPFPFADKALGQFMDTAWADGTGTTGATGSGGSSGGGGGGGGGGSASTVNTITTAGTAATLLGTGELGGSVNVLGGADGVSWPAGAFPGATVTVTLGTLPDDTGGFAAGSATLTLTVTDGAGNLITNFTLPLRIHVAPPGGPVVPSYSADGVTWRPIPRLASPALPDGQSDGYYLNGDGSYDIYTLHASSFGLLKDIEGPTAPGGFAGRFEHGVLLLTWTASSDNSGAIDHYLLDLNGTATAKYGATTLKAVVRKLGTHHKSAFVLKAVDPSGNLGTPSHAVTATPVPRPHSAPKLIPDWAFRLLAWEERPAARRGPRPETPSPLPDWYEAWKAWRLRPFTLSI